MSTSITPRRRWRPSASAIDALLATVEAMPGTVVHVYGLAVWREAGDMGGHYWCSADGMRCWGRDFAARQLAEMVADGDLPTAAYRADAAMGEAENNRDAPNAQVEWLLSLGVLDA